MPIDYKKYAPNWKTEIVPAIKERDGHRCKFCGVANYSIIDKGTKLPYHLSGTTYKASLKMGIDLYQWDGYDSDKSPREMFSIVVLTCMHLDHDIANNHPDNLAMGCQRCHNSYDREHRNKNSKTTNAAKKAAKEVNMGVLKLF